MAGQSSSGISPQTFDYFLVLDFEATCLKGQLIKPQEIIEFPVLKICSKTFETTATFHEYVQPRVNKELSSFCTELTGIIQDMVENQPFIEDVLQRLKVWMDQEQLQEDKTNFIFVTMGDWDLKKMLPSQADFFHFIYPDHMKKWINIKKPYAEFTGTYPKDMMEMLKKLGIKHEGRHHSGIDDCKNIAKILRHLGENGVVFRETGALETETQNL